MKLTSKPRMIYTPKRRIPIGEAIQRPDGSYALRVKKPNKDEFDEIPMDTLITAMVKNAGSDEEAS